MNINNVKFEISFGLSKQLLEPIGSEFVFVGRSNVGKSSLINKLFSRKSLARVSGVPGKTATINFYRLDDIRFVDLPGYGYAKIAKDEKRRYSELINGYFTLDRPLELVFLLIDMRHKPSSDDMKMVNFFIENEIPFVIVLTKCDKLNATQRIKMLEVISDTLNCDDNLVKIPCSSETGEGVEQIREIIDEIISEDK